MDTPENTAKTGACDGRAVNAQVIGGSNCHEPFPGDLARVVAAWPTLPADVRAAIVALALGKD